MKSTPENNRLQIGKIPYANLYPIFYYLENKCDTSGYRFIKNVPAKLNQMLREGMLDVSPSSSIEYLKNKDLYQILPWFSISSAGPINSIYLFSRSPLKDLDGKTVAVSSESETSTALLKIILAEFYSITCTFRPVNHKDVENILSTYSAVLHIGDTAMTEYRKTTSSDDPTRQGKHLHIYDLGDEWNKQTGLPFVYALWVVRKQVLSQKKILLTQLSEDLAAAGRFAADNFALIAREAPHKKWIREDDLVSYWKTISYDLTENHMKGLRLFDTYVKRMGL